MEFLEGNDLADELARLGSIDTTRGIRIALQICRALAAAHNAGVVHRDMKPDNVFLQRTGDGEEIVKIVDFGIAQLRTNNEAVAEEPKRRRLTKTGMIFGTPEYMSPEQAGGKQVDKRVDVYAVGVILYEMFTGAVPFTGDTFMAVLAAHLNDVPPSMHSVKADLELSQELQAVILRALAKRPDERFQTMNELAAAMMATPEGVAFNLANRDTRMSQIPASHLPFSTPPTPLVGALKPSLSPGANTAAQFRTHAEAAQAAQARTQPIITQLEGSSTPAPIAAKKGAPSLMWASLALLVALGVGAFVLRGRLQAAHEPAPASAEPVQSAAAIAVPVTPPTPEPVEPKVVPAPVETQITLSVETTPPDAVVTKNDFQACNTTPCEIKVSPGEAVTLVAKKANLIGTTKILAQKDQAVTIELKAPIAHVKPPGKAAQRMCEVDVGGLKILRPCKE
jgi:serine/threonine-protein kinase